MTDRTGHKPKSKSMQSGKKVFDVMRPGKAPASATSRPVIVGHKPQIADDQFVPGPNTRLASDPNERHPLMDNSKKVGLAPFSGETPAEITSADTPSGNESPPIEPAVPSDTAPPSVASTPEVQPTDTSSADQGQNVDNTPPAPAAVNEEQKPAAETLPLSEHLAAAPKEQPEPFTPSNEHEQSAKPMTPDDVLAETDAPILDQAVVSHHKIHYANPWKWVLIFLVVLLVAVAVLNFLLDAEVITTDLSLPHTDVLKD